MLEINIPYVEERNGKYFLCCDIKKNDIWETVYWGGVSKEMSKSFLADRADAFLIGVLDYAVKKGENIKCNAPVSEDLLINVKTWIIPLLEKYADMHAIKIYAEPIPECEECAGNIGTAVSGGIDSFYTILVNSEHEIENRRLTHLCINDVGNFNADYGAERKNVRNERYDKAREIASECRLPLICTESNYYEKFYVSEGPAKTILYGTFSVLCMKKFWKKFYMASSFDYEHLGVGRLKSSLEVMELLFATAFSTGELTMYIDGIELKRLEKTRKIANNSIVQRHLHVCLNKKENCGYCEKCKYTLIQLDAVGELKNYAQVFNIADYIENRKYYMTWLWNQYKEDPSSLGAEAYEDFVTDPVIVELNKEDALLKSVPIVIFGFSTIGRRIYKQYGAQVIEIIDNNVREKNTITYDEFKMKYDNLAENIVFVVASSNQAELLANKIKEKYPKNRIVIRDVL